MKPIMGIQQIKWKSNETHCGNRTNTIGNYVKPIMGIQRIKWKSNKPIVGIELTHREIDETQPSWEYSDQWDFIQIPLMDFCSIIPTLGIEYGNLCIPIRIPFNYHTWVFNIFPVCIDDI